MYVYMYVRIVLLGGSDCAQSLFMPKNVAVISLFAIPFMYSIVIFTLCESSSIVHGCPGAQSRMHASSIYGICFRFNILVLVPTILPVGIQIIIILNFIHLSMPASLIHGVN